MKLRTAKKYPHVFFTLCLAACLLVFSSANAYAYLDAGTGSYVFQMLIAGLMGALFMVKAFWQKIVMFFRRTPKKEAEPVPETPTNTDE